MSQARYIVGDTRTVLKTLPDASADVVITSPAFLALRSYLAADDPNKHLEMGSEATPGAFLDALLDVVVELRRVLAPHGSLCVELGDTYAGTSARAKPGEWEPGEHKYGDRVHKVDGWGPFADAWAGKVQGGGEGWPLAKSLCMVPQSFAWALAYGRNPWTGREIEPWRVRNIVRWCRPNPPVGALGDKFRPATSEMVVACVSGSRYFDLDAVREPFKQETWSGGTSLKRPVQNDRKDAQATNEQTQAGAPPLDYWVIPTHPYPGSHYATYPPELCVRPIKAMCPEKVCRVCGKPSERITECANTLTGAADRYDESQRRANTADTNAWMRATGETATRNITLGWSDCGHNDYRRGLVLDPFAGSGTTLEVATGHGRDAIGIDLDPRNADLARARVGMFLTIEEPEAPCTRSSLSSEPS